MKCMICGKNEAEEIVVNRKVVPIPGGHGGPPYPTVAAICTQCKLIRILQGERFDQQFPLSEMLNAKIETGSFEDDKRRCDCRYCHEMRARIKESYSKTVVNPLS